MLKYFDSHAHYIDERFSEDREKLLLSLKNEGNVEYIMNVGYDIESSKQAIELSDRFDFCYSVIGVHPHDADGVTLDDYDILKKLSKNKKVKAIGETGLDYHYDNSDREKQKEEFANHLDLAKELKLPVVIHSREATKDTLDIILPKDNHGVFHCFAGSVETAKTVLDKGYYISFSGTVTYKNANNLKEVAKYVPKDRFLIETDCPYLAPVPVRGERNTSFNLKHIVEELAGLRGDTPENIARLSLENAKRLFGV